MTTVHITLPDQLAQDAKSAGLLSPKLVEQWLRDQLKTRRAEQLFSAIDRMSAEENPSIMSPEEIATEIICMRAELRAARHS